MSVYGFLGIIKIRPPETAPFLVAARHNKREEPGGCQSVNPTRSHLNKVLRGLATADEVNALRQKLTHDAGITKPKKGSIHAIEFLFSLPVGSTIDPVAYSKDCIAWVAGRFGGEENILSADLHLDEAAPHCHILLLPLVSTRKGDVARRRMNGSDMLGVGDKFEQHLADFYSLVGNKYGLKRAPPKMTGQQKATAVRLVLDRFKRDEQGSIEAAWSAIVESIKGYPDLYIKALGIELPAQTKPARSF